MGNKNHACYVILLIILLGSSSIGVVFGMQPPIPNKSIGDVKPTNCGMTMTYEPLKYFTDDMQFIITFSTQSNITVTTNQLNTIQYQILNSSNTYTITTNSTGYIDLTFDWKNKKYDWEFNRVWKNKQGENMRHAVSAMSSMIIKQFADGKEVVKTTWSTGGSCLTLQGNLIKGQEPTVPTYYDLASQPEYFSTYEDNSFRLTQNPNVCILEPDISRLDLKLGSPTNVIQKTQLALSDWKLKLNDENPRSKFWDITWQTIPLAQQNNVTTYDKCNIIFYFTLYGSPDNIAGALGLTNFDHLRHRVLIEVFYTERLPPSSLEIILRHEFGHALGLGHFVVPHDKFESYSTGDIEPPSIMFPRYQHQNRFSIEPHDVRAVETIYDNAGFSADGSKITNEPTFVPDYIKWKALVTVGGGYLDYKNFTQYINFPNPKTAQSVINSLLFAGLITVPDTYNINARDYVFNKTLTKDFIYPWVNNEIADTDFIKYLQHLIDTNELFSDESASKTKTPVTITFGK